MELGEHKSTPVLCDIIAIAGANLAVQDLICAVLATAFFVRDLGC
jgi:hypothetical protein